MTTISPSALSDAALLAEAVRVTGTERRATAELVALLAEVDARRLYLGQGYPSLFAWCTGALHLSEPAAYSRITAARAARHTSKRHVERLVPPSCRSRTSRRV